MITGRLVGSGSQAALSPTDLLGELLASEEEAQQAADDHGQHRQDEQPVLLADVLHSAPHFFQSQRHPPPAVCPGPLQNHQSNPLFHHLFSHKDPRTTCRHDGGSVRLGMM